MSDLLLGFLPWILYSVIYSSLQNFHIALAVAVICLLCFSWRDLKDGFILSWTTLIYFCVLLIVVTLTEWQWPHTYMWLISNFILACMAFGSFILGKPFTIQYAKRLVDKTRWAHPLFMQINNILTLLWGCIFLCNLIINYIHVLYPMMNETTYTLVSNMGWIIGALVSRHFPNYWRSYQARKKHE